MGERGGEYSLSHVTRGRGERDGERENRGAHPTEEAIDRAPIWGRKRWDGGPHVKKKKYKIFLLEIMIHLEMIISPSFLIRFGCFWARWKALDE